MVDSIQSKNRTAPQPSTPKPVDAPKSAEKVEKADKKPVAAPESAAPAKAQSPASAKPKPAPEKDRFVQPTPAAKTAAQTKASSKKSPEDQVLQARQSRRQQKADTAAGAKTQTLQTKAAGATSRSLVAGAAPAERTVTFEYDTGGRANMTDIKLKGSWNKTTGEYDAQWGGGDSVKMFDDGSHGDKKAGDGVYTVQQTLKDDGTQRKMEWGVTASGPAGKDQWAVMKEGNLQFKLGVDGETQQYSMTTDHKMGLNKVGADGASFRVWLPNVPANGKVTIDLQTAAGSATSFKDPATGKTKTIELVKDEKSGVWSAELPAGWKNLEGKFYQYKIQRPDIAEPMLIKDPYSRYQQGQQRGVERVAIDNATGAERAWYWDSKDSSKEWGQFKYKAPSTADAVSVQFKDASGKALDKAALEKLIGNAPPEVAAQMKASWKDRVAADGTISLAKQDAGNWGMDFFNFRGAQGLQYEVKASKAGKPLENRKGILGDDYVQNREEVKLAYKDGANPKSDWGRFEVQGHPDAERATLILKDASGKQLTKDKLLALVGEADPALRQKMGNVWQDAVQADGTIDLTKKDGAFRTMIPNFEKLVGLKHELRVYKDVDGDGKTDLVGDKNKDGKLSATERSKYSAYNDPNEKILEDPAGSRGAEIRTDDFAWKNDNAQRMETDPSRFVIYEAHVGSFFSPKGDQKRATFDDMIKNLDYMKKLGVNTIELMPTSEFAGAREWGYTIVDYFSGESAHGFEDKDGKWVTGTEAIKRFMDAAHEKGFNVLGDVVYNHVGDRDNHLWKMGGAENPFYDWGAQSGKQEIRNTPWGALPAYNQQQVKQFFVDHAVSQVEDLHFDGLRFDFTSKMHSADGGGQAGWEMLREINKTVKFLKPGAYTTAEEFPNDPGIADPVKPNLQGAGFDSQWNDPFHDRLLENVQKASKGWKSDMDGLIDALVNHPGRTEGKDGVTYIHSHDEVGNTSDWVSRAADNYDGRAVPSKWAADQARNTAGLVMLSTGTPMIWQGEEFLANDDFKHGRPDTWGMDWNWQNRPTAPEQVANYKKLAALPPDKVQNDPAYKALKPEEKQFLTQYQAMGAEQRQQVDYDAQRWGTFRFYQDAIAMRKSSPAFDADADVQRVYAHNDNAVAAFTRKKGNDEYLVITSFNKNDFQNYGLDLPPGSWKEVMNSDGAAYGGDNFGNGGGNFGGHAALNIPAGGMIVLKKVG